MHHGGIELIEADSGAEDFGPMVLGRVAGGFGIDFFGGHDDVNMDSSFCSADEGFPEDPIGDEIGLLHHE